MSKAADDIMTVIKLLREDTWTGMTMEERWREFTGFIDELGDQLDWYLYLLGRQHRGLDLGPQVHSPAG